MLCTHFVLLQFSKSNQMYNIAFYLKVLIILILPFLTTPGKVAKLDFE